MFGRVTPDQKKRMVTALQSRGHVVAMTGDGVNDALAIKTADIGIAMNSGAAATKAVARLVLLDGRFSHLPSVVAEGRRVIANIERVSMLFLTKTVYATGLAVLFGALVMEFPFLPRQLSITDGLTIGIPAFFLALLPNAQRYVPGFLRRSLSFAIPAGIVIAVALTVYTRLAMDLGLSVEQLRTGATVILAIVAIWVLTVLSRPVTRVKVLVIGAMFIALTAIFTLPPLGQFFQLRDPGGDGATLVTIVVVVALAAIEAVRFGHRRFVRRSLATRAPAAGGAPAATGGGAVSGAPTATGAGDADAAIGARAATGETRRRPAVVTAAIVLVYVGGLLNTALGVVVLLARYAVTPDLVLPVSLVGAATVLLGLLTVAGGSALSRGSVLARALLTGYSRDADRAAGHRDGAHRTRPGARHRPRRCDGRDRRGLDPRASAAVVRRWRHARGAGGPADRLDAQRVSHTEPPAPAGRATSTPSARTTSSETTSSSWPTSIRRSTSARSNSGSRSLTRSTRPACPGSASDSRTNGSRCTEPSASGIASPCGSKRGRPRRSSMPSRRRSLRACSSTSASSCTSSHA